MEIILRGAYNSKSILNIVKRLLENEDLIKKYAKQKNEKSLSYLIDANFYLTIFYVLIEKNEEKAREKRTKEEKEKINEAECLKVAQKLRKEISNIYRYDEKEEEIEKRVCRDLMNLSCLSKNLRSMQRDYRSELAKSKSVKHAQAKIRLCGFEEFSKEICAGNVEENGLGVVRKNSSDFAAAKIKESTKSKKSVCSIKVKEREYREEGCDNKYEKEIKILIKSILDASTFLWTVFICAWGAINTNTNPEKFLVFSNNEQTFLVNIIQNILSVHTESRKPKFVNDNKENRKRVSLSACCRQIFENEEAEEGLIENQEKKVERETSKIIDERRKRNSFFKSIFKNENSMTFYENVEEDECTNKENESFNRNEIINEALGKFHNNSKIALRGSEKFEQNINLQQKEKEEIEGKSKIEQKNISSCYDFAKYAQSAKNMMDYELNKNKHNIKSRNVQELTPIENKQNINASSIMALKEENIELSLKVMGLMKEKEEFNEILKNVTNEMKLRTEEIEMLQNKIYKHRDEEFCVYNDISLRDEQLKIQNKDLERCRKNYHFLKDKVRDIFGDVNNLQDKYEQIKETEKEKRILKRELQTLKEKIEKNNNSNLLRKIENNLISLRKSEVKEIQFDSVSREYQVLKNEKEDLKRKSEVLEISLKDLREQLRRADIKIESLEKCQIDQLQLIKELNKIKNEKEKDIYNAKIHTNHTPSLKQEIVSINLSNAALKNKIDPLKARNEKLEKEILKKEKELKDKLKDQENTFLKRLEEITELSSTELSLQQKKLQESQSAKSIVEEKLKLIEKENNELAKIKKKVEERFLDELKEKTKMIETLKDVNDKMNKDLVLTKSMHAKVLKDLLETKNKLELTSEEKQLMEKDNETNKKNLNLILKLKLKSYEEEIENLNSKYISEEKKLNEKIKILEEKVNFLKHENLQISKLQKKLQDVEFTKSCAETHLEEEKKKNFDLQLTVRDKDDKIEDLKSKIEEKEKLYILTKHQIEENDIKLFRLHEALESTVAQLNEEKKHTKQLNQQLDSVEHSYKQIICFNTQKEFDSQNIIQDAQVLIQKNKELQNYYEQQQKLELNKLDDFQNNNCDINLSTLRMKLHSSQMENYKMKKKITQQHIASAENQCEIFRLKERLDAVTRDHLKLLFDYRQLQLSLSSKKNKTEKMENDGEPPNFLSPHDNLLVPPLFKPAESSPSQRNSCKYSMISSLSSSADKKLRETPFAANVANNKNHNNVNYAEDESDKTSSVRLGENNNQLFSSQFKSAPMSIAESEKLHGGSPKAKVSSSNCSNFQNSKSSKAEEKSRRISTKKISVSAFASKKSSDKSEGSKKIDENNSEGNTSFFLSSKNLEKKVGNSSSLSSNLPFAKSKSTLSCFEASAKKRKKSFEEIEKNKTVEKNPNLNFSSYNKKKALTCPVDVAQSKATHAFLKSTIAKAQNSSSMCLADSNKNPSNNSVKTKYCFSDYSTFASPAASACYVTTENQMKEDPKLNVNPSNEKNKKEIEKPMKALFFSSDEMQNSKRNDGKSCNFTSCLPNVSKDTNSIRQKSFLSRETGKKHTKEIVKIETNSAMAKKKAAKRISSTTFKNEFRADCSILANANTNTQFNLSRTASNIDSTNGFLSTVASFASAVADSSDFTSPSAFVSSIFSATIDSPLSKNSQNITLDISSTNYSVKTNASNSRESLKKHFYDSTKPKTQVGFTVDKTKKITSHESSEKNLNVQNDSENDFTSFHSNPQECTQQ